MTRHNKLKKIIPEIKLPIEIKFHLKIISFLTLISLFLFSFYIRGIVPIKAVFSNGFINFAMDDAVMQIRLVEHAIAIFPKIHNGFYDAFTLFPTGDTVGWGPLFSLIIAFFSVIFATLTNTPLQESIGIVGAFTPAIFGSLLVFPIYFIGKELSGYKAGLIGAFLIVILPGQILSRSVLGFTDHHVVEVFFTTFMMLFLIMAFKRAENIDYRSYLRLDWKIIKPPVVYSILAGISFGFYLLTWPTGVLFAVIFATAIIIQYIFLQFKHKSSSYLAFVSITTYLVAMVMILPFVKIENGFSSNLYSLLHIVVTGGAAVFILFLSYLSNKIKQPLHYTIALVFTLLIGYILSLLIIPSFLKATLGSINYIFVAHTGGSATISEGMALTTDQAFAYFGYNFVLSSIAILLLVFLVITKTKAEHTLIVVWSIYVYIITFAQNRFAYYYAINVAILSAFLVAYILNLIKSGHISSLREIKANHLLIIPIIFFIAFMPVASSPFKMSCGDFIPTLSCTSTQGGSISEAEYEWHDSLTWLRNNTPEPDVNYLADYKKLYNYSVNDYGIMSWWDYGHIITYWGHRIPNANPFQSGVQNAARFLIATSEEEANSILDSLGINNQPAARYVISNAYMAYNIQEVFAEWNGTNTGLYTQIRTNQGLIPVPTMKYYNTFESKLHIFDANSLKTYRLVHESTPAPWFRGGNEEQQQKYVSNTLYGTNIPIENTGYVKIFEHVKGAKISATISPDTPVTISTTIRTNINRTFVYSQSTTSDSSGTFTLTVPYSTTGPILIPFDCSTCYFPANKGGTNFDTYPITPYALTVGNKTTIISVSEKDVLTGNILWQI